MGDSVFWAAFGGGAAAGSFTIIALLVAEWFRWYIDRPLLMVSASLGQTYLAAGLDPSENNIYLDARNPHSHPVTVSSFGVIFGAHKRPWRLRPSKYVRLWFRPNEPRNFPYQIEGGRSLMQWHTVANHFGHLRELGLEPQNLTKVWFLASSGKYYYGKVDKLTAMSLQDQFDVQD